MQQPRLFTNLIVTYNSAGEIADLLGDLSRLPLSSAGCVLVVDNKSQDLTRQLIKSRFPAVRLIENRQNVGFAKAVNQGFELCSTEYVFLLNPDMRITDGRFYPDMLKCMEESPRVAAVGPLQFRQGAGRRWLNLSWSYWSRRGMATLISRRCQHRRGPRCPVPTTFLNTGCLLIRRSAFMRVGKLCERYFLYGEEPDLFLKFKRYGYECRLHPGVEVVHYRERSLRTLPRCRRLMLKAGGLVNIGDGLFRGLASIGLDRLRGQDRSTADNTTTGCRASDVSR